ncbi:MAG TPA: hypothetical protein DCX14_07045 [Flavobacteriales bacterium]|nr:hypothetical protein [Flavobacteriales bacterium]
MVFDVSIRALTGRNIIMKPNFLIVGAPKCGTTALYKYLGAHPNIFMPEVKEPYYYIKPKEPIGEGPKDLSYRGFVDSETDYRALFESATEQQLAIGEASAGYLYFHELAISRIKRDLGDVKIIILIRDPVARAFSSHVHHVRGGREDVSFEKAWHLQDKRKRDRIWFGFQLRDVGFYAKAIAAYQQSFSQVKIILNDDLNRDTTSAVKSVFNFLEVSDSFDLPSVERHNQNLLPRCPTLAKNLQRLKSRGLIPQSVFEYFKNKNLYKPELPLEFAKEIAPDFEADLRETSQLVGRDLSFWLEKYK